MAIWKPSLRLKISKYLHSYSTISQGILIDVPRNFIVCCTLTYYNTFPLLIICLFIYWHFFKLRVFYAGEEKITYEWQTVKYAKECRRCLFW